MELVETGVEEMSSFRRVADAARYEQARDERWERCLASEGFFCRWVLFADDPALGRARL
jgi:hypothetical protein